MTPARVAASTSTLSRPTPARATTRSRGAQPSASASIWVALRTMTASAVRERGEQGGPVGAVRVAHLEVGFQLPDRGWGKLLGDEDNRCRHDDGPL